MGRVVPGFIPYGSTESTESLNLKPLEPEKNPFHPIRLDREH